MRKIFLLFYLLLIVAYSYAQSIVWDGKCDYIDIANKLSTLEDPKGDFTFEQVSAKSNKDKFKPSDKVILNFGFTESYHWLRFSVDNPTADELQLEIAHAFLPYTDLYYTDSTGKTVKLAAGYKIPLDEKIVKHHYQVFPIPQGKHDYYVRLLSNSHPLPVRIYKKSALEISTYHQRMVFGFYIGFMIFVILSNLFFFFSLRNKLYLLYACVVCVYISYAGAVMDGFILYFYPHVDLMFWYITVPTIGIPIQMVYCLLFLEAQKYTPKLNRFTWGLIAYFTIYLFLKLALPLPTILAINTVHALISFFMMGWIGYSVGKKGNKLGYYFALAYFIYFLLVLTEATYIQIGKPAYIAGMSHVAVATLIEAFILSFLLSKRFEWEKDVIDKARMEAQMQLVASTLEKEKLVREQNIILEEKVEIRTKELQKTNDELNVTLHNVEKEREKSDHLLLNILPSDIAKELKENGIAKPKIHTSVSVLFADVKDFTQLSSNITPEQLINDLNECFEAFDRIVQKYHIEKIKTIGDAYMAAGGLTPGNVTHPYDTICAAVDMQKFIFGWKEKQTKAGRVAWDVRIGIHTGPAVSGVVGVHKFSYDIWGDTVNTASRMESSGEPGKVNISHTTYEMVKNQVSCIYRGNINVKGKGEVNMYFVETKEG